MKSLITHYKNKYPGGSVRASNDALDVYSQSGEHVIAMRKNGAGQLLDASEELGLRDRHDLAPIPKDARLFKVRDGKIAPDELHEERKKQVGHFVCPSKRDVVLSCHDLKAHGFEFCDKQKVLSWPKKENATLELQN